MSGRSLTEAQAERVQKRLQEIVDEHGGTQVAAARALHISQQQVSKIMARDPVGLNMLRAIADHDQVPISYVMEPTPSALYHVIKANPKRWTPKAVSAVRDAAQEMGQRANDEERFGTDYWIDTLDKADMVLSMLFRPHMPPKR